MFKEKYKKSLRFNFLVVMSGILIISTAVLSSVIAINEGKMLKRSLMTKGQSFASYIAKLSQDPLIMKDSIQLDSFVNEAKKDEDIMYIVIEDANGNVFTSQYASVNYQSSRLKTILPELSKDSDLPDIISAVRKKEAVTEFSVPILSGIQTIGKVTICMSQYHIHKQIVKTILFVIALNLLAAFVLGSVLFIALKKTILDPIIKLGHAASCLAKGDLSTHAKINATGEIQMLVNSFNQMAEDLQKTTVSKDYLDNIIKSMIDTLIVVSPDGIILRTNTAANMLLGYEEKELIGRPVEMVLDEKLPLEGPGTDDKYLKKFTGNSEKLYITKDSRKIPVMFSASIMRNDHGTIQGVVCAARDMTERKRAEEEATKKKLELEDAYVELQATTVKLAKSNSELEQFTYIAYHDLQEPLRMVSSYLQLLERRYKGRLGADADEFIGYAVDGAVRIKTLILDMLTYTRVGSHGREFKPVNCEDIIKRVLVNMQIAIEESGAVVTHESLPAVMADETQLSQLFQNLVGNAIKFNNNGPPSVHISSEEKGNEWVFSVKDNGIGIAPEYIDRIFGIFQRLHKKDEYPGTGIGLAVCKKIVERHGGEIWVESGPAGGATFYFTITKGSGRP